MRLAPILQPLTEPLLSPLVTAITGASGGGFSPISLFSGTDKGYIFDNNDLTSFYLDSAGTTPALVNGLVGLQLDKSGNLALGAELVTGNNSTFDSGVGSWATSGTFASTGAAVGGEFQVTITAGFGRQVLTLPSTAGKTYKISGYARYVSGGAGTEQPMLGLSTATNGSSANYKIIANSTSYVYVDALIVATGANIYATCGVNNTSATGAIVAFDNISVKELSGNHRYQTTTGSKPILRGTPVGGNLVTNGDFAGGTTTGWTASAAGSLSVVSGRMRITNTAANGGAIQGITTVIGGVYRITIDFTKNTINGWISVSNNSNGSASFASMSMSATGNFTLYFTATATTTYIVPYVAAGVASDYIDVDNIIVQDASASAVTAPYGLQYDGVDDFLTTASVDFTATDKMAVVMGVRKLSDASQGVIVELSASAISNNGSFAIVAPSSGTAPNYVYASKGTTSVVSAVSALSFAAPITNVVSGISDIAADNCVVRCNGADSGLTATDQGTGNYGNYALFFGRRGGSSSPYNGLDFGGVCIGKTLTATQLANVERWVNQRTGAY
jgi:hypothetical protein